MPHGSQEKKLQGKDDPRLFRRFTVFLELYSALSRRGWIVGICFLVLPLIIPIGFLNAGHFLAAPSQPQRAADAIVLLGGDTGSRGKLGLDLVAEGYADNVVLVRLEFAGNDFNARYSHGQVKEFLAAGIRRENIFFDNNSWHSWDEAVNTLQLMKEKGWSSVLVVSDPPHMRRLKCVWGKVFRGSGLSYTLVASRSAWWQAGSWWKEERSAGFVFGEFGKMIYYLIRYGCPVA